MLRTILCISMLSGSLAGFVAQPARADAPAANDALAEITVTAEKQSENLQKAAAEVTAISADVLIDAGITDLRQAQMVVPSVRFQAEGNNTQVFIRGVGANLDFPNVEPNVAFNFAGVYLPREATSAAFFDVQQLEVLPGSQGTLYGRSAIGGTINLTPAKPGFDNDGETTLEVGNYSYVHVMTTQNVKASDSVALRAAVDYAYDDGYEVTGADSKNDISVRLSTIINPTDRLSIYLWGQGAQKDGRTENLVNKGTNPATGTYCESCFFYRKRLERYAHGSLCRAVRHDRRAEEPLQDGHARRPDRLSIGWRDHQLHTVVSVSRRPAALLAQRHSIDQHRALQPADSGTQGLPVRGMGRLNGWGVSTTTIRATAAPSTCSPICRSASIRPTSTPTACRGIRHLGS